MPHSTWGVFVVGSKDTVPRLGFSKENTLVEVRAPRRLTQELAPSKLTA
jgi:hypothetical protein